MAESLLLWLLVIKIGPGGIWAFMGHHFKSDEIARYIGWPAGNLFQEEVAFTNLALGACGVMCFFYKNEIGIDYAHAIPFAIRRRQSPQRRQCR